VGDTMEEPDEGYFKDELHSADTGERKRTADTGKERGLQILGRERGKCNVSMEQSKYISSKNGVSQKGRGV
jgi:hypothetical protein